MLVDLKGRTALITGASRGIGRAIARQLSLSGASVSLIALDENELSEVSQDLTNAPWQALDVGDTRSLRSAWHLLSQEMGRTPDIVIHSAGHFDFGATPSFSRERWDRLQNVHLNTAFELSRLCLPPMQEKGWGRLIFVSSVSGRTGERYAAAYSAAKAGLVALAQSLAKEFASSGICVNAICPGWVNTELAHRQLQDPEYLKLMGQTGETVEEWALSEVPQKRMIEPDEVAALACFLASSLAGGITGQAIHIDGGLSIHA